MTMLVRLRLTVGGSVLKHESFIAHHHQGRSVDTRCHCCCFLGCIVLRGRGCCALIQFMHFLMKVTHVLDAVRVIG